MEPLVVFYFIFYNSFWLLGRVRKACKKDGRHLLFCAHPTKHCFYGGRVVPAVIRYTTTITYWKYSARRNRILAWHRFPFADTTAFFGTHQKLFYKKYRVRIVWYFLHLYTPGSYGVPA